MIRRPLKRIHLFLTLLALVYAVWIVTFFVKDQWHLFSSYWPMSLTMVLGSFVAGSSAIGGGGVAYPVFTKVLQISPEDARTFSLMIQTVGMGMAAVFIWANRIKVLWKVIVIASLGGMIGIVIGTFWLQIPSPFQKITLSYVMGIFGVVLVYLTWGKRLSVFEEIKEYRWHHTALIFAVGILGGLLSANVGSGADILVFILLTLAFGIHEQVGTPTSVVIMAINAAIGFFLHASVVEDIQPVYDYWLVCIPVVALGAPLGALVISIAKRHHLIFFLLALILVELTSTLVLVSQNDFSTLFGISLLLTVSTFFWLMLEYRKRITQDNSQEPRPIKVTE